VDVLVTPKAHLAGAQFDLIFDPSLATAISVEEGNLFNQTGFNTFFLAGTIDNDAGTIAGVACVITTPGGTMTALGTLATITFIADTTGTSPLDLSNVIVGGKNGQRVAVQANSGSVAVEE